MYILLPTLCFDLYNVILYSVPSVYKPGVESRRGYKFFLFAVTPQVTLRSTQLLIQWVLGALPRVKRMVREADESTYML
jgi:hypothetical protein